MAVDELLKNKVLTGLAIGIGAGMLAPKLLPVLAEAAKPLVKGAMKGGLLLYEKGREIAAEAGEYTEDWWAEVKAEMEEEEAAGLPPEGPPEAEC